MSNRTYVKAELSLTRVTALTLTLSLTTTTATLRRLAALAI